MADLKISELPEGGLSQNGDEVPVNRSGDNAKVTLGTAASYDVGTAPDQIPTNSDISAGSSEVLVSEDDAEAGYLDDKINVGILLTKQKNTDTSGYETLTLNVRSQIASNVSVGSGTHNVNIANGDFHQVTATGVFTFSWTMANGQSVFVRGIDFDTYSPVHNLQWGDVGVPDWTGKDDFVVYRDNAGNYIGSLIVGGIP